MKVLLPTRKLATMPNGTMKNRPNHFFAIQVSNPDILAAASAVQQCVLANEPHLKTTMISLETLHLTLGVMHLSNADDINRYPVCYFS